MNLYYSTTQLQGYKYVHVSHLRETCVHLVSIHKGTRLLRAYEDLIYYNISINNNLATA